MVAALAIPSHFAGDCDRISTARPVIHVAVIRLGSSFRCMVGSGWGSRFHVHGFIKTSRLDAAESAAIEPLLSFNFSKIAAAQQSWRWW
jgi:hypothetical protein